MRFAKSLTATACLAVAACGQPKQAHITDVVTPSQKTVQTAQVNRTTTVSDTQVHTFATGVLNNLQPRSIRERREYCGYIVQNRDDSLSATPASPGTEASCELDVPGPNVIASYHTHGSYSFEYDNEVPSSVDLQSDFDFRTDGYIATPGGRIWHVDYETQRAYLLCGPSCVYTDPGNASYAAGQISPSYTLRQLYARER